MNPPDDALRADVALRLEQPVGVDDLVGADPEDNLHQVLTDIAAAAQQAATGEDVAGMTEQDAWEALAGIDSWAALASYAVGKTYAPASPWPRNVAGWSSKIAARLRELGAVLHERLKPIAKVLGATDVSVSASFPWGLSVGLSWSVTL